MHAGLSRPVRLAWGTTSSVRMEFFLSPGLEEEGREGLEGLWFATARA